MIINEWTTGFERTRQDSVLLMPHATETSTIQDYKQNLGDIFKVSTGYSLTNLNYRSGLFRDVRSDCARWKFLEFIPVVHYLVAASPALLQIVENGSPRMVSTCGIIVLFWEVVLVASFVCAFVFAVLHDDLLHLLGLLSFKLLLLFLLF